MEVTDSNIIAGATVLLVLVTGYYALQTRQILAEAQKDRKIRLIERRLEKLYFPLQGTLPLLNLIPNQNPLERFQKFQYLGSEELKAVLKAYFKQYPDPRSGLDSKIKQIVEGDIPILEKELDELAK